MCDVRRLSHCSARARCWRSRRLTLGTPQLTAWAKRWTLPRYAACSMHHSLLGPYCIWRHPPPSTSSTVSSLVVPNPIYHLCTSVRTQGATIEATQAAQEDEVKTGRWDGIRCMRLAWLAPVHCLHSCRVVLCAITTVCNSVIACSCCAGCTSSAEQHQHVTSAAQDGACSCNC